MTPEQFLQLTEPLPERDLARLQEQPPAPAPGHEDPAPQPEQVQEPDLTKNNEQGRNDSDRDANPQKTAQGARDPRSSEPEGPDAASQTPKAEPQYTPQELEQLKKRADAELAFANKVLAAAKTDPVRARAGELQQKAAAKAAELGTQFDTASADANSAASVIRKMSPSIRVRIAPSFCETWRICSACECGIASAN